MFGVAWVTPLPGHFRGLCCLDDQRTRVPGRGRPGPRGHRSPVLLASGASRGDGGLQKQHACGLALPHGLQWRQVR